LPFFKSSSSFHFLKFYESLSSYQKYQKVIPEDRGDRVLSNETGFGWCPGGLASESGRRKKKIFI